MSGSEVEKERLKETFSNSPMPDFEKLRELKPSPLKPVEIKLTAPNKPKVQICPICKGDVCVNIHSGNGFCVSCDYTVSGKL